MSALKDNIKKYRTAKGFTLQYVADKVGITEATMQRYESGEIKNIKHATIVALADVFGVDPSQLMGWDTSADGKSAEVTLTGKDKKDIAKNLDGIMQDLENVDGLMFDGDPMSDEAIESLRSAMLMGLELVKLKNKKKYGRKTKKEPNK